MSETKSRESRFPTIQPIHLFGGAAFIDLPEYSLIAIRSRH